MATLHTNLIPVDQQAKNFKDITRQRFGILTVTGVAGARETLSGQKYTLWNYICDCGAFGMSTHRNLKRDHSCGCKKFELMSRAHSTHGHTQQRNGRCTTEYRRWRGLRDRCNNQRSPKYIDYGGRGINVCQGINSSLVHFLSIIGNIPGPMMEVDRKDNNKGYTCGRCDDCRANGYTMNIRWATKKEQGRNKRNNRIVEYLGQRKSLIEWSEILQINYFVLWYRLSQGDEGDHLFRPVKR